MFIYTFRFYNVITISSKFVVRQKFVVPSKMAYGCHGYLYYSDDPMMTTICRTNHCYTDLNLEEEDTPGILDPMTTYAPILLYHLSVSVAPPDVAAAVGAMSSCRDVAAVVGNDLVCEVDADDVTFAVDDDRFRDVR